MSELTDKLKELERLDKQLKILCGKPTNSLPINRQLANLIAPHVGSYNLFSKEEIVGDVEDYWKGREHQRMLDKVDTLFELCKHVMTDKTDMQIYLFMKDLLVSLWN